MEGIELLENFTIVLATVAIISLIIRALIARFISNNEIEYDRNLNKAIIPTVIGVAILIKKIFI